MTHFNKRVFRWGLLSLLVMVIAGIVVFLMFPSNYYVRRTIIHRKPTIDQYAIFENRLVVANSPQPWDFAPDVENKTIAAQFNDDFEHHKTAAFVVVQHNRVLLEQYWSNYSPLSYTNSFSMAKSIISLLVGCAITDGKIKSVDQPVSDFFPEWTLFDKKQLTIKDLLTMSAGVDWDESYSSLFSKTTQAYYGNDLWGLTQSERLIEKPGVRFNYQSGVTQLLAFIVQKATGKKIANYASEKLWTPIHAEEDALWSLDRKDGMEKAFCCFNTNARDFARLGQLVLNKGFWDGIPVVDSAYIREATSPATWLQYTPKKSSNQSVNPKPRPCNFYGYQFWIMNYKGLHITYFRGMLGQYIFIIPELDAVIVRLGRHRDDKNYNLQQNYPLDIEIWLEAALEVINRK